MTIHHISDTARWVAYYRAMETDRPDPIFRDPYARRLAGPEGEAIVKHLRGGRSTAWAMIVRTAVFDELILERVTKHGADLVLNLAAGLDARPWRLPLPASLHWVDVDLPDILGYKAEVMRAERPVCHYEAITTDLTDAAARHALMVKMGAGHKRVIVVSEGLLGYLERGQVGDLARELHAQQTFLWWIFDLASPRLLRILSRRWGRDLSRGNAPFKFAPAEGTGFFRPFGWREEVFRSALEEARRLHREMRFMWLWRALGRMSSAKGRDEMRRMSGFILLAREQADA